MYDGIWNLDYRQFFCHIAVVTREEETCVQGLTLRFQAKGQKRSFDEKLVVKNRISGYFT